MPSGTSKASATHTTDTDNWVQTYTDTTADTYAPAGLDSTFNLEDFKRDFTINVLEMNEEQMIFEMIGIDAPFANAFRRILIAEVRTAPSVDYAWWARTLTVRSCRLFWGQIPTMAIDQVYIYDNTSIVMDEVLSHRLGLIPINADPRLFDFRCTFAIVLLWLFSGLCARVADEPLSD